MDTTYPKLRDLSFLQSKDFPSVFPTSENWQITVMKDDDVMWNIVLAFLNSFPESNKSELDRHVVPLLGKEVGEDVQKNVEKCNPFLYNNACFGNETFNLMVQTLREAIGDYYRTNSSDFSVHDDTYICLQASSILLSCSILLFNESSREIKMFPKFGFKKDDRRILVIFENPCANGSSFSFCMPKEFGFRKQKLALHEILMKIKCAESERNITPIVNSISSLPGIRDNFIISLLESDVADYIPLIYKSPYILSKIRDAALKTDPTIENGEGKSALFYALTNNKPHLLYFLYDHAANDSLRTAGSIRKNEARRNEAGSIRNPDSVIVMNLIDVERLLKNLEGKVESFDIDVNIKKKSLQELNGLCRFNDFQIDVCLSINTIRSPDIVSLCKVCEAKERRDIIMDILRAYEKYFEWNSEVNSREEEFLLFYEFLENEYYFNNLDFCSAVMFFDNLYLLKERLMLSKKTYMEVESRFFFFIYCKKYFERIENSRGLHLVSRMIIFQERLLLKSYLRSFKEALENEFICESNTVDNLPETEVRTLTNIPQIYSEFLVLRLKHYLKAAASIKLIDFKAVLILQRTLQVIGECVKDSDFKSVQKVFSLIVHEELLSILKQIRNELVHPKGFNFSYRISAEKDYEFFNEIQKEIVTIEGIFNPIFCAHKNKMEQFAISSAKRDVDKARTVKIPDLHKRKFIRLLAADGKQFPNEDNFEDKWKLLFEELSYFINCSFNRREQVTNRTSISQLKYIFENIVNTLKKEVNSMKSKCNNVKASIDYVDIYFFSMEYMFTCLTLEKKFKKDLIRKVIRKRDERKTLFQNTLAMHLNDQPNNNAEFQQAIENILSDYEQTIKEIFLKTNCRPGENVQFTFEHIKKFKKILKGHYYINETEKENILKNIPDDIKTTLEIKSKIKNFLDGCLKLNEKEFGEEIDKLPLKPREKQELLDDFGLEDTKNSLIIINSVLRNFYPELQDAISKNELDKKQYEDICNGLNLPESSRDILSKIIKGKKWNVREKRLHFLRNRIKQLKAILIDEDASIKKLWESPQSTRKKSYVHELLVNVYLNDPGTQAAVEMLLFDCMTILKTADLEDLCRKTTNLFNGINLRNVLAHGNPLLESLGRLLDPTDLPSELVRKMIDLISDLDVIDCMVDILDKKGHVFETFTQFMNVDEDDGFKELRQKIASSHNWKQYAKLIPQGSMTASPSPNELTGSIAEDSNNDVPGPSEPEPQDHFSR